MIIYVTRDIERALAGIDLPDFCIMTNATPFAKELAKTHTNIHLIEADSLFDTWELLESDQGQAVIAAQSNPAILVFKNSAKIERICTTHNWTLLNPSAALSNTVEQKISQVHWLGELTQYLPPWHIAQLQDITWQEESFILQFNSGHTGTGTHLISSAAELKELTDMFPKRETRVTQFVAGPVLTNNNVVTKDAVVEGNINYQITGLEPLTDNAFATIGNDWTLPQTMLSDEQRQQISTITQAVGTKLQADGWLGLFGLDLIIDQTSGTVYLLEINARQPASVTFESTLQQTNTTFAAHLAALKGQSATINPVITGAQLVLRHRADHMWPQAALQSIAEAVSESKTMIYTNTKPGTDALRIMSSNGMMTNHAQWNNIGKQIAAAVDARMS